MRGSSTNDNQEDGRSQADLLYTCPKCGSNRITIGYPDIRCFSCGYSEPLIDFPMSWNCHRQYAFYYGGHDLGPNEPPERTLDELHESLKVLEEHFDSLSDEDLRRLGFRHIKEELDQLKLGLRYTQRLIPKPARKKAPKRVVTTEV